MVTGKGNYRNEYALSSLCFSHSFSEKKQVGITVVIPLNNSTAQVEWSLGLI